MPKTAFEFSMLNFERHASFNMCTAYINETNTTTTTATNKGTNATLSATSMLTKLGGKLQQASTEHDSNSSVQSPDHTAQLFKHHVMGQEQVSQVYSTVTKLIKLDTMSNIEKNGAYKYTTLNYTPVSSEAQYHLPEKDTFGPNDFYHVVDDAISFIQREKVYIFMLIVLVYSNKIFHWIFTSWSCSCPMTICMSRKPYLDW